jgi:hypothetical protein
MVDTLNLDALKKDVIGNGTLPKSSAADAGPPAPAGLSTAELNTLPPQQAH